MGIGCGGGSGGGWLLWPEAVGLTGAKLGQGVAQTAVTGMDGVLGQPPVCCPHCTPLGSSHLAVAPLFISWAPGLV